MPRMPLVFLVLLTVAGPAAAQDHSQHSAHVGKESREVKALADTEVAELLAGEGMGLALAAELNAYPGPRHVLDHATELDLTDAQRQAAQQIFDAMQARARSLGERIVEAERQLDGLFANRTVDSNRLRELTAAAGALRGELRFVHLQAHLETTALLSDHQVHLYDMVRGYRQHGGH
ncbi:MAG TPA: Spy/CpxP family protein refolding chaperone [Longimicrobiales bacterium]|nr:Spy/CpxP family protein refolding chaperone [Longimicrobiales bacterium]